MGTWNETFPGASANRIIDVSPLPTDEVWTQFGDQGIHGDTEVGLDSSSPPGGIERLTPIIPTTGSPRYAVFGREASQWDAGKITFDAARIDSGDDPDWLYGVFFNYDRSTDDGFAVFVKSKTGALTLVRIDGGQVAGPSSPRAGAGMFREPVAVPARRVRGLAPTALRGSLVQSVGEGAVLQDRSFGPLPDPGAPGRLATDSHTRSF